MTKYFTLFLILVSTHIFAIDPPVWYEGVVVLANDEVLTGEVALHTQHDLVLFRQDEGVTVYPAHKIQHIFYYDQKSNINRKFTSLAQGNEGYEQHTLYEIVLRGTVMVLRKERWHFKDEPDDFNYYVVFNEEIISMYHFRNKVFPHLSSHEQTASLIREEHLNPNLTNDVIRIIQVYNQSISDSNSLARKF